MKKVYGLAGILVLSIVTVGLLMYVQALTSRIATLEAQAIKMNQQVMSHERSYCSNSLAIKSAATTTHHNLESSGVSRTYQVHTPHNYDPSVRYPVVVSFDGIEGSGSRIEGYSGLNALPAILVYPDSLPGAEGFTAWQGAPYSLEGDRDMQFVRDLLVAIPLQYCTDSTKIFAVGMSNGGGFAVLAGCRFSGSFRAVASVSGAYYSSCEEPGRTPSFLALHSMNDRQVPFGGSTKRGLPSVIEWTQSIATERKCETIYTRERPGTTVRTYDWAGCKDGSLVRLFAVLNQEHGWLRMPQSQGRVDTAEYIWEFFQDVMYTSE